MLRPRSKQPPVAEEIGQTPNHRSKPESSRYDDKPAQYGVHAFPLIVAVVQTADG
jgi:hypothetical protein